MPEREYALCSKNHRMDKIQIFYVKIYERKINHKIYKAIILKAFF